VLSHNHRYTQGLKIQGGSSGFCQKSLGCQSFQGFIAFWLTSLLKYAWGILCLTPPCASMVTTWLRMSNLRLCHRNFEISIFHEVGFVAINSDSVTIHGLSWTLGSPISQSFTKCRKYPWTFVHDIATNLTFMFCYDHLEIWNFNKIGCVAMNYSLPCCNYSCTGSAMLTSNPFQIYWMVDQKLIQIRLFLPQMFS